MRLGITPGDPLGIGPEIVAGALAAVHIPDVEFVLYGPECVLNGECRGLYSPLITPVYLPPPEITRPTAREPSAWGGIVAMHALQRAVSDALNGDLQAIVTAPVSKQSMALGGWRYPGQTELLAELTDCEQCAMLLAHGEYRAVPATRHIPLRDVSSSLTVEGIRRVGALIHGELTRLLGRTPRIDVCGLNPHAGDNGLIGTEESSIIAPAVDLLKDQGVMVNGPISSEEAFISWGKNSDVVIAMYHDQAAIPVKMMGLGRAVNVTLGLPFIRTSPGHGTAFSIAGTGSADSASMGEAIAVAVQFAGMNGIK